MQAHLTVLLLAGLLFLTACVAHAGGFVCGHAAARVWASDQVTVITLTPTRVTVDMHITLEGLRQGEILTYVLPCWARPWGLTLGEATAAEFQDRYVVGAYARLLADTQRDAGVRESITRHFFLAGVGAFGLPLLAPMAVLEPVTERHQTASIPRAYAPTTPPAHVLSYTLKQSPWRGSLDMAGLPRSAREALRQYNTPYCAEVKIVGTAGKHAWDPPPPLGLQLHFYHLLDHAAQGRFIFPLGAGSAWAKPVTLNELYITCPQDDYLVVSAPVLGHEADQAFLNEVIKYTVTGGVDALRDFEQTRWKTTLPRDLSTVQITADHELPRMRYPASWHRAYFQCRPGADLTVRIAPRPRSRSFDFTLSLVKDPFSYLLALLGLLLAWGCAFIFVVAPSWRRAGKPGHLRYFTLWALGAPILLAFISSLILYALYLSILSLWLLIPAAALLTALLYKQLPRIPVPLALMTQTYSVAILSYLVLWGAMYLLAGVVLAT